jgi:hypothetical protein
LRIEHHRLLRSDNKVIWRGNTHCRGAINDGGNIRWPKDRRLDSLRGQTIRLRFFIKHARLFTFEARTTGGLKS